MERLNITLDEIKASLAYNQANYTSRLVIDNSLEEKAIFDSLPSKSRVKDLPLCLSDSLLAELSTLVKEKYFDSEVMELMLSVVQAIYAPTRDEGRNILYFHDWLPDFSYLAEGRESIVFYSSLGVLLKYSPGTTSVHEILVGLLGTNSLRKLIPNFSYIYGGFAGSGPLIEKKELFDLRRYPPDWKDPLIDYALSEALLPSVTVVDLLEQATPTRFMNWFLQLLLSLQVAQEQIGFSHFDLHAANVLLRKTRQRTILYPLARGEILLQSEEVVTIIDFSLSTFLYQGRRLKGPSLSAYIGEVDSFPLYDVFKFLATVEEKARFYDNRGLGKQIKRLLRYFSPLPSATLLASTRGSFFALPTKYAHKSLYDLIDFTLNLDSSSLVYSRQKEERALLPRLFPQPPRNIYTIEVHYTYLMETRGQAEDLLKYLGENSQLLLLCRKRYFLNLAQTKQLITRAQPLDKPSLWLALVSYRRTEIEAQLLLLWSENYTFLNTQSIREARDSLRSYRELLEEKSQSLYQKNKEIEKFLEKTNSLEATIEYNEALVKLNYLDYGLAL